MLQNRKLVLIDGHALAYRAFHALPEDMRTSRGELTNAVYGFTAMLLNVLRDERPTHIAVTFDKGLSFRHDVYPDYKAHRTKMPGEMRSQMERVRQVVEALGIPIFEQEGYEADDLLGTLARQAEEQGVDTLIVTGDMDLLQLVDKHTRVLTSRWRFSDTVTYDLEGVQRRYGLTPAQLVDLKALVGDKSDNIPGVPGVGEKTAVKLLQQYGSLEGLYGHLDEVSARFRNQLEAEQDLASLSRRLATIARDAPVQLDLDACRVRPFDRKQVLDLFRELEFRSLVERLPQPERPQPAGVPHQLRLFGEAPPAPAAPPGAGYQIVADEEALRQLMARLESAPALTLDIETTHTDPRRAELVGIALTDAPERGYYIPITAPPGDPQLPLGTVLEALALLLSDSGRPKYGHNIKYDLTMLQRAGGQLEGLAFDTMVAEWLINPASKNLGLKNLAWARLKQQLTPITDLIGKGKGQRTMRQVSVAQVASYACTDVDMTRRLVTILSAELKEKRLWSLFTEIEMPLVAVLAAMEMAGVRLDVALLERMSDELAARLGELETRIQEMVGYSFNVNSTQQLSDALFKRLRLPTQGLRRTKSGHFSTAAGVLERLQGKHAVIDLILEQRELAKLKSTYVDALPRLVNPRTGRLHTSYNQTGTVTGRISCLPAGTLVNTQHGLVGIETVRPGDLIRTPYGPRRVLDWVASGEKPVMNLKLSNGITLKCSPQHLLRSRGAWIKASDITVGTPVYMSFTEGLFGEQTGLHLDYSGAYPTRKTPVLPTAWTVDLAELVGYHLADGHVCRSNYNNKPAKVILAFGWNEDDVMDHFEATIQRVFGKSPTRRRTKSCPVLEVSGVDIASAFVQLGATGKSGEIRVPPSLFTAPEPIVAAFLRGYFEGDGYVGNQLTVRSVSRAMLEDVQQLLTLFGIPSTIREGTPDPRGYAPRYTLRIVGDRSKGVFNNRIGFLSARKRQACAALAATQSEKSTAEIFSLPDNFDIRSLKPALYVAHRSAEGRVPHAIAVFVHKLVAGRHAMTSSRTEWIVDSLSNDSAASEAKFLREVVAGQHYEVRVIEVSYSDPVPMFDIAVADVQQYLAQGIVVHNSSEPNLQNIPVRTEIGRQVRRAFVAEPGWKLVSADYSQVELRVMAHVSGDAGLLSAFARGEDIHASTAATILGVPLDEVTPDMRRLAKTVNFGLSYGQTAYGLAQATGLTQAEAEDFIKTYFERFPKVREYIDRTKALATRRGYVETLLGRRRYFPELQPGSRATHSVRQAAERMAINAPIQGCLPYGTRVLTSEGYRRIGELYDFGTSGLQVWTGTSFASFEVLCRGPCELAELVLENGCVLRCDTRHEVLVADDGGYEWKKYPRLMPGDKICLALPQEIEYGSSPDIRYEYQAGVHNGYPLLIERLDEEFFYWLGYYFGDGWIHHRPEDYRWCLTYSIGSSNADAVLIEHRITRCTRYFASLGLRANVRHQSAAKAEVTVHSRGFIEFLADLGIDTHALAATKRVPDFVFGSPLSMRKAFLRGMLDADGCKGGDGATTPNLHLCQRGLLEDLWLLFRTIGVEGKMRGPYSYRNSVSYRLDLVGGLLHSSLGFSECQTVRIPGVQAPRFLIQTFLDEVSPAQLMTHSHKVLYSRLRHGGTTSVYTLAEMTRNAGISLSVPIYAWSALRDKHALGTVEDTYTIAIADPLHRFDSEGVISKNTAADIIKIAMLRLHRALQEGGRRARMLLQVHDELVVEAPDGEVPTVAPLMREIMENAFELKAPLKADLKVGQNWEEME